MTKYVSSEVTAHVAAELKNIEKDNHVQILLAVESGSRAWGFPSPDSDYDVRFLYVQKPEWYVSIRDRRDVIELPLDPVWDINGWDLKKSLQLLMKSNPVLLEWLSSPIVYTCDPIFTQKLRSLASQVGFQTSSRFHYLNLATTQYRRYVKNQNEVRLKKYFYVLRPALALMWLRENPDQPLPMNFQKLMTGLSLPAPVLSHLDEMIEQKSKTKELGTTKRLPEFDRLIEAQLEWAHNCRDSKVRSNKELWDQADDLFYETVTARHETTKQLAV